ncbi:MAG: acyl-CoA thioester hydrolase, partial [Candidatus Eremiobacteraeota bacterium]|nr:acyl-CoA thioester hydrolase [Candidatus Eremiobacteraeota bacterium]
THVTRTRVRFGETDAAGIVFYPTFFAWFDVGMSGLLRAALGGELCDAHGRPRFPVPIVEAGARFVAPLHFDDAIAVRSTITELGRSSLRVEHTVLHGEVEAARGFEVRVLIQPDEDGRIKARPLPPELRAALAEPVTTEDGGA